jgi:hypothetical protein
MAELENDEVNRQLCAVDTFSCVRVRLIFNVRPGFLRVRKGAEGALINIHTNEGA